ncbi:MAG: hypothetical protein H6819_11470 [Phycisphaerales bacterium]|nr:hypothetical protein [Phycisphaerales bacterium]MCB9856811.1 hypothetical protein [Phycisphaerales bacterium]MCB9862062.1 hypothetical protein [Phycisphaerales bacterium]
MSTRFELDNLTRDNDLIAQAAFPNELFSFMTRQAVVPPTCVALVETHGGQPYLVSAGKPVEAEGTREVLFVRCVPFEFSYEFADFESSDGFRFSGRVDLTVSVVPDRTELASFKRELVGSNRIVNHERLRRHCEEAVQAGLARFMSARPAEQLVRPDVWEEFDAVLAESFKQVGFSSGLALGRDPRLSLKSTAYEESRSAARAAEIRREREQEEARRRQEAVAARDQHLTDLGAMLAKVRDMADATGALDVAEMIKSFSAEHRGELYQGLLSMDKAVKATERILVVAGSSLVWFDPAKPQEMARKQKLPKDDIGSLRSVRVVESQGAQRILVGARNGVHVLDADGEILYTCILHGRPELRGGFNAATMIGTDVFATHSEVGLVRWRKDSPETAIHCLEHLTEGCRSVRDVQCDDSGRIWLGVDNIVVSWNPKADDSDNAAGAPDEVTTLSVADGYATAGLKNGAIVRWLTDDMKHMETLRRHTGSPVRSVAWLSGGGIPRLLVGDSRPYLELMVLGDSYHGQYRCLHEMRWGFAAEDIVVGVNEPRDTFILWKKNTPDQPAAHVSVRRLTGRSIQDVALL